MTKLARSAIVVGSCAAALAIPAAPAAAAWSAPEQLPGTAGRSPLFAAYGADSSANVGSYGPLALIPKSPQAPVAISSSPSAMPFGAPSALRDGLGSPVAVSLHGTILAVGGPRSPLDYFSVEGPRSRLRVGIGPAEEPLKAVATPGITGTRTLASAVNDSGDAAVVYSRCIDRQCGQRTVLATFRRRGRSFATPIVLARRTGYPAAAVALNARGDAIVAWIEHRVHGRGNDIRARVRRSSGTLTKTRIAGPTAPVPTIAVTLSPSRHGTVAWFSEAVGEGSVGGPLTVSASNIDARGTIGTRSVLDSATPAGHGEADAVGGARLRAILGADGATTFAWTGFAGGHYVVRASRVDRGVERDETLSPPGVDAQLMDLAGGGPGGAIAVWATRPGTAATPVVAAAIRPAGARLFGPSQVVLAGAGAGGTAAGAIALDGRAIVAGGPVQSIGDPAPPAISVARYLG